MALRRLVQPWLAALRDLPENPLLRFIARPIPPKPLALMVYAALWAAMSGWYYAQVAHEHAVSWVYTYRGPAVDSALSTLRFALLLAYMFWLLPALYDFCRSALNALQPGRGRLRLADLADSPLSDHELLLGTLGTLLDPMWPRIFAGAALVQLLVLMLHWQRYWWGIEDPWLLAVQLLGGVLLGSFSGLAATAALGMLLLGLGRGRRFAGIDDLATGGFLCAQFAWVPSALYLNHQRPWISLVHGIPDGGLALSVLSLVLAVTGLLLLISSRVALIRTIILFIPFGLPWLWQLQDSALPELLLHNLLWSIGTLIPFNPIALNPPLHIEYYAYWEIELLGRPLPAAAWLRTPIYLLYQLALLALSAWFAGENIHRWRRGE